ncbi:MAG: CinA family nicotinamide mononucleotide deamidase-related protein [Chlamydiales bacterium]|nr:CinA family nicotinamide mononucleotide deamidase-related protein [Chlamydiales bacterium]
MNIHLISIGNELLYGSIANTNAQFLSKELTLAGYLVTKVLAVKDERNILLETLQQSFNEADITIITGGLGPTFDDITREVLCDLFHAKQVLMPGLLENLKERYGNAPFALEDQATQPDKATILPNKWGTAPGLLFHEKKKTMIALPGVPSQMKQIFMDEALPVIKEKFPVSSKLVTQEVHVGLIPENTLDPLMRKLQHQYATVDFGIYPSYGSVTIRMVAKESDKQYLDQIVKEIKKEFAPFIYSYDEGSLAKVFHHRMIQHGYTLALAESCSGGHFAARLTSIPDASKYFLGSMVTYSNLAKTKILNVKQHTLDIQGSVSKESVIEMAQGIIRLLNPDIVIAISGVAGPSGGSKEKPVGTVWVCFGKKDQLQTQLVPARSSWSRELIIDYTINWVLAKILLEIIHE